VNELDDNVRKLQCKSRRRN